MTKEQEKQLDKILVMFHLDDTLYNNEEYHRRKKAIFTLVDRFIKAGRVQPEVKPANCEPSVRPSIKDFFPESYTPEMLNKKFLHQPNLYGYIRALDNYIDELESRLSV